MALKPRHDAPHCVRFANMAVGLSLVAGPASWPVTGNMELAVVQLGHGWIADATRTEGYSLELSTSARYKPYLRLSK